MIKILAIDDLQDNLTTLKAVVGDALPGCTILTALNGTQGVELARAEDPDVILLDIVMPGMDGFEVCRRLKADERLRSIPVMFLTALRTDRGSRVRALEVGAEAFLSKPLDEQELVAQVRAMVKLKAANRLQRMEKEELAALVTERTQELERELEARKRIEAELKAIYDHTPIIMCLLDEEQRVARVNRMGMQMANREVSELSELRGGELMGCINSMDDPRGCGFGLECGVCPLRKMVLDTIQTGHEYMGVEVQLPITRGSNARKLSTIIYTARLEIEGQTRVLLCVEDITERKHLEEQFRQAQKMDAIGQLAGGVAHDFNNIIASTLMHLGLLRTNPKLDKETQNDIKELEVQSNRAAALTRQLLAFGRRSTLDVKVQDLNDIIANLLKMLRRLIGEHIDLQFKGKTGLPLVIVDIGMMEQVVMNLTVNARDAMPKGGQITITTQLVEVTVTDLGRHPDRKPGRFVCVSVADTGYGMNEETLKRIFEPFFTTKEVGQGTGLGLATVHGIVAQHKGWVEVESTVGQGTTFHVYIPVAQTESLDAGKTEAAHAITGGTETLLLVEDEPTLRRVASMRLRQLGYRVIEAHNGQDALAQWATIGPLVDLLFTDMVMPGGLSGFELAAQLRLTKPGLKVITTSGYSSSLAQSSVAGQDGIVFLSKPYDSEVLAKTVRDCLDGGGGKG